MRTPHYDWIRHHAKARPDAPALTDLTRGRVYSYAELDQRIARAAGLLAARGVGRGDRVAALAQNCSDLFEILFACGRVGAIFVPLNWRLTVPELTYIASNAEPVLLFHDAENAEAAAALVAQRILMGGDADSPYERELAAAEPFGDPVALHHDDVQVLMYTSGTTGFPKGAMLTYAMSFWNAINIGLPIGIGADTRFLSVMPFFHTAGINLFGNPVFHAGGHVLMMRSFEPGATLAALGDPALGITHFFGVPAVYLFMAQHPDFAATDLGTLRIACVGGAATPPPLLEIWTQRGIPLANGYGMTETGPGASLLTGADAARKQGSVGQKVLHVETRIVRSDGSEADVDEAGELWVRGPGITPGYWRDPVGTGASFVDGWLKTGDVLRRDAEGFLFVMDRAKDMYISGGENVYPAEVEGVLHRLEGVADAAVIGVSDERWGETGLAIVVVRPDVALDEAAVLAHCRDNLARFKHPRAVIFTDVLPRTASGKIHKPTLRERFGAAG